MYGCGEPFLAALLGCAAWVAGNEICLSVWSDLQRVVRTVSSSSPSSKTMPIDPGLSKLTSTGSSSSSDEDSAGAGSAASSSSSNARSTTGGYATPGTPRHGHACTSGPSNMLDIHGAFAVQNPNEGCGRVCQWVCMGPEPCQSCAVSILCLSAQIYTHCSLSSLYFSAVSRFLNLRQRWIGAGGREQTTANSISTGDSLVMILLFTKLSGSPTTSFPATFRSSSLRAQRLSIDGGPSTRMEDADDICESLKHGKH